MATLAALTAQAVAAGKKDVTAESIAFTLGFLAGRRARQQASLHRLICKAQKYEWGRIGRDSKVARLMEADGQAVDAEAPYAEYWFGTHPEAPSSVAVGAGGDSQLLSEWLRAAPERLGRLRDACGASGQLPFLLKVLSVEKALSIQAHPDKKLAERLNAERPDVYKDDNHKPEMAVALTDFEAMCGFRPIATIVQLLGEYPEFAELVGQDVVQVGLGQVERARSGLVVMRRLTRSKWM
jgi:mannose-6-phosphate isomerase